jgi:CDP-diacylglycerol--serine O-phosphatidyltransferase
MPSSRHLRRGIYLLPTTFTVANLLCGYSSVVYSARGSLELASVLLIVAAILDGLDGRIARSTGSTSDFGLQFDSLADMVSFGVAPAFLVYHWALAPFGRPGWLMAFIYVVCAAMRLARFNIQTSRTDKRHFAGLPSPPAAGVLASIVFAFPAPIEVELLRVLTALLAVSLALLMISRFRYRTFKELDLRVRRSYMHVLPLAALLVAVALKPRPVMLALATAYLVSAPAVTVWNALARRHSHAALRERLAAADAEVADEPAAR